MDKPTIAYTVVNKWGQIVVGWTRELRKQVVREVERELEDTWESIKRKHGLRVVKVRIEILP